MTTGNFEELLASSEQVISESGGTAPAQVGEQYPLDRIWDVVASAAARIEGAKIYEGRDANQLVFISNTPPRTGSRRRRRAGQAPPMQVTVYKSASATFNNFAVIDLDTLTEQELAAGKVFAHKAGDIELTPQELAEYTKVAIGEIDVPVEPAD